MMLPQKQALAKTRVLEKDTHSRSAEQRPLSKGRDQQPERLAEKLEKLAEMDLLRERVLELTAADKER